MRLPTFTAALGAAALLLSAAASAMTMDGKVTQVIDGGGYTYVEMETEKGLVWVSGPTTPLKAGDKVEVSADLAMQNFHSKALDRDFETLYFVDAFSQGGKELAAVDYAGQAEPSAMSMATDPHAASDPHAGTGAHDDIAEAKKAELKTFEKAEGGLSIAELLADKAQLVDTSVRLRGQVTKFSGGILGSNWIHIKDASHNDLTVTTDGSANIGDVVTIEGTLALNKDYGYGYLYEVIVIDAKIVD